MYYFKIHGYVREPHASSPYVVSQSEKERSEKDGVSGFSQADLHRLYICRIRLKKSPQY